MDQWTCGGGRVSLICLCDSCFVDVAGNREYNKLAYVVQRGVDLAGLSYRVSSGMSTRGIWRAISTYSCYSLVSRDCGREAFVDSAGTWIYLIFTSQPD